MADKINKTPDGAENFRRSEVGHEVEVVQTAESLKAGENTVRENVAAGMSKIQSTRELQRFAKVIKPMEAVLLTAILAGFAGEVKAKEIMTIVQEQSETGPQSFDAGTKIDVDDEYSSVDRSRNFEAAKGEKQHVQLIKEFVDNVKQHLTEQGYIIGETDLRITEIVGIDAQGVKGKNAVVSDARNKTLLEGRANEAVSADEKAISEIGGDEGMGAITTVESRLRDTNLLIVKNVDGGVRGEKKDEYYASLGVTSGQADKYFHWKNKGGKGIYKNLSSDKTAGLDAIALDKMREGIATAEMRVKVGIETPGSTETVWTTHNKKLLVIEKGVGDHKWLEVVPLVKPDSAVRPLPKKEPPQPKKQRIEVPVEKARNTGQDLSRSRRGSLGGRSGGNIGGVRV